MKKPVNVLMLFVFLFGISSCDDILEDDIANDIVQIRSPREGAIIEGGTVQFLWQDLDGADSYRVQVTNANRLIAVDSIMSETEFTYNFEPGDYQWRIRGENFAFETAYTFPVNFAVKETENLSSQTVILQSPSENLYTNSVITIFNWNSINVAEQYSFQLVKKVNGGEQTVFQDTALTANTVTVETSVFDEDAEYLWKVKALNTTSETVFSERTLFLDTVVPNQPTLSSPDDASSTAPSNVTFNWTNGADTGNVKSAITNRLEIATDNNFNTIIHSTSTTNNSIQFEFTTNDTYYWRVIAEDEASNKSDFSTIRSIVVE